MENVCKLGDRPAKPNSEILVAIVTEDDVLSSGHLTDKSSKMCLPSVRLPIYSIYLTLIYFGSSRSHMFHKGAVLKNCAATVLDCLFDTVSCQLI